jgi:hypothetical protein
LDAGRAARRHFPKAPKLDKPDVYPMLDFFAKSNRGNPAPAPIKTNLLATWNFA